MTLFEENLSRTDNGPAGYAEAPFKYLNRSARLEVGRIRSTLEEWFKHYPSEGEAEFRTRFRSDEHHDSAFFELFLHELLLRLDCSVTLHPSVATAAAHPDFLVNPRSGASFYLEAVLATDQSAADAAR